MKIRDKSDTGEGNLPDRAFEGIYKSYYVYILNFAYSFVMDRAAAEDIAQDVFWKLWRRPSWLPQPNDTRSYLLRLAKNECLNYLKHKGVEDRNKQKLVEALLFSETSGWGREDEEAQARVRKCLDPESPGTPGTGTVARRKRQPPQFLRNGPQALRRACRKAGTRRQRTGCFVATVHAPGQTQKRPSDASPGSGGLCSGGSGNARSLDPESPEYPGLG